MNFENPSDDVIRAILSKPSTVAVVGCSNNPDRDSFEIARLLKSRGFRVFPVNPALAPDALMSALGERCYADLALIPVDVDIVDVFRRAEFVSEVVDQAIAKRAKILWCQLGVIDVEAARRAQAAGMTVVMD